MSNTFDVSGHDTIVSKEGTGTLNYVLTATPTNAEIGDTVTVKIEAINKNLVYHALQDCQVSLGSPSVSILDWDQESENLSPVCPNVLGVQIIDEYSKADSTSFSFTAFKWSTQNPNDVENQTIQCTISLSEEEPIVKTTGCEAEEESKSELESCAEGTFLYNNVCSGNKFFNYEFYVIDNFSVQVVRRVD